MQSSSSNAPRPREVAVIDIGATSVRMAIAEIDDQQCIRPLEALTQAVSLGKDVFTHGFIQRETIEDCVRVLKIYRRKLEEYKIDHPSCIRIVATSAVREARNRFAFLDRLYIASGFDIEPFDEAELHRVTYLGVQAELRSPRFHDAEQVVVCEVGGGSTETLVISKKVVTHAQTFRLGSLRMRRTLEAFHTPSRRLRSAMERQIVRTAQQLYGQVNSGQGLKMLAMGGDLRFAAQRLLGVAVGDLPATLPLEALETWIDQLLERSVDELVHDFHLSFPDAETLTPALIIYSHLARTLGLSEIHVANINLRDGLLLEMASRKAWTTEFSNQITRSALDLGRKYQFDEAHALQVAEIARSIFRQTQSLHGLEARYELILYIGALLHELGVFISHRSLHKHSMYIIRNSDLFGLGKRDLLLVSLVARYHRRAHPEPTHEGYADLPRGTRVAVAKMASLLRLAKALDDARGQRISEIYCRLTEKQLILEVPRFEDISLEQLALQQNSLMFEEIFGKRVSLRSRAS